MGPASRGRVRGSGGLVPAEALTTAASVEPDGEPGAAWLIVQNDRVALGTGEGALTAGGSEAGEGGAAVGGDRCAGDVDGAGLAVLNVSDWVTWGDVSAPVTRSTSAAPYARGVSSFLMAEGRGSFWITCATMPPWEVEPPCARPQAIMMACARKFSCLSMPSS